MTIKQLDAVARLLSVVAALAIIFTVFWVFRGATSPFFAFSIIGATAIHISSGKFRVIEAIFTVISAYMLSEAYGGIDGSIHGLVGILAFCGLGSLIMLGVRAIRDTSELDNFLLAVLCPLLAIITNFMLAVTGYLQPNVIDWFLFKLDGMIFQCQPSAVVGQWFVAFPALRNICSFVYSALPLAEILVFILYLRGKREMPFNPMIALCIAGVMGFFLYQLYPAVGPKPFFGSYKFPFYLPTTMPMDWVNQMEFHNFDINIPRNAMPSLHTVWALLIWKALRNYDWGTRGLALVFVVLTLLATLGLGEHYAVDLMAGVPVTYAVIWLSNFNFKCYFQEPAKLTVA